MHMKQSQTPLHLLSFAMAMFKKSGISGKITFFGIPTYKTVLRTINQYVNNINSKMEQFRRLLNLRNYYLADGVAANMAQWNQVLLPSDMYVVEVMPMHSSDIEQAEQTQYNLSKLIVGVPHFSAHASMGVLL